MDNNINWSVVKINCEQDFQKKNIIISKIKFIFNIIRNRFKKNTFVSYDFEECLKNSKNREITEDEKRIYNNLIEKRESSSSFEEKEKELEEEIRNYMIRLSQEKQ